jgi:pimeloyl-ACP methyl ester carboxylesterase
MQLEELSAGHGALKAVRAGTGPDIVVLHGLLTDRHAFDPVLPALANKHRVTLFNLPGFHDSQPPLLPLLDAYVAAIEDGFDEFKIGKDAVLIGNGFGGTLALALALAHPERVAKLVLVATAACYSAEGREEFVAIAREAAGTGLGAVAETAAKRIFSPGYLAAHPEKIEERRQILLGIEPRAFQAACKIMHDLDLTSQLHHLRIPTLVVCGSDDQATPPDLNKQVAKRIQGGRYVELPGCGHCPPLEQPDAFVDAIREFADL